MSGQQVQGCQGSQDVHVPSRGSSSAQLLGASGGGRGTPHVRRGVPGLLGGGP